MPERQFDLKIRVSADANSAISSLQKLGGLALGGLVAGLGAATAGIGALALEAINGNAAFEQYETQFATLLGSTEAAQQRMKDLALFGATTPFDLPGVVEADRVLQGFGLHSEDVADKFGFAGEEIRRIAGDVAAGTGTGFEEMALLIGKFSSGATGEALARMAELGIGTREQLAGMGLEFSKSGQLMSPLPEATEAVLTLMKEKYGGLMEAQSVTLDGMLSNLGDWVGNAIRTAGKPIFDEVKEQFGTLLDTLNTPEMQGAIEHLGGALGRIVEVAVGAFDKLGGGDILENLPDIVNTVTNAINGFADTLVRIVAFATNGDLGGIATMLVSVFGGGTASADMFEFAAGIDGIIVKIGELLGPIFTWLTENVSLGDVLTGLGVAIATFVVPAIISIISAIGPVIAIFAAVVLAVSLLRQAWENDFMGVRTALTEFWENTAKPALENLWEWLSINVPKAIETLSGFWNNTLMPALRGAWDFINTKVIPILEAVGNVVGAVVGLAVRILAGIWENVLLPAIRGVWAFISEKVIPLLDTLANVVSNTLGGPLKWLKEHLIDPLIGSFGGIKVQVEDVVKIFNDLASGINNLSLPGWLTPGSPTPFELGLVGINDAMDDLAGKQLPSLSRGFGSFGGAMPAMAGAGAAGGSGGEDLQVNMSVILDGREVGYGTAKGTLDAFRQQGLMTGARFK